MPKWRKWQTRHLEGVVGYARGGSNPPFGTIFEFSRIGKVALSGGDFFMASYAPYLFSRSAWARS